MYTPLPLMLRLKKYLSKIMSQMLQMLIHTMAQPKDIGLQSTCSWSNDLQKNLASSTKIDVKEGHDSQVQTSLAENHQAVNNTRQGHNSK